MKLIKLMLLTALVAGTLSCVSVSTRPVPATPIDAVSGVLSAFEKHSVVALGEGNHNNEQAHAFRLSLIRDPRFAGTVNDIVLDSGQEGMLSVKMNSGKTLKLRTVANFIDPALSKTN